MAPRTFGSLPHSLELVDSDDALSRSTALALVDRHGGSVSLCVRTASGHASRGGYFFHIAKAGDDSITFSDVTGASVITLKTETALRLINHASGRVFDAEMLRLCQTTINFKEDG